jgi:hypothetical protein
MESDQNEKLMQHGWRYFELHATQRISVFNFFVALLSTISAALGFTLLSGPRSAGAGMVIGLLLTALSFVFWKLDQRRSFLLTYAEKALIEAEKRLPPVGRLFTSQPSYTIDQNKDKGHVLRVQTYGWSIRFIFSTTAVIGLGGFIYSTFRICWMIWKAQQVDSQNEWLGLGWDAWGAIATFSAGLGAVVAAYWTIKRTEHAARMEAAQRVRAVGARAVAVLEVARSQLKDLKKREAGTGGDVLPWTAFSALSTDIGLLGIGVTRLYFFIERLARQAEHSARLSEDRRPLEEQIDNLLDSIERILPMCEKAADAD